jgi:hypothetical protein
MDEKLVLFNDKSYKYNFTGYPSFDNYKENAM